MKYSKLSGEVERTVTQLFQHAPAGLVYHSLDHTRAVVLNALAIAIHYKLSEKELFIIHAAAWFHDTGYLTNSSPEHEARSVKVAQKQLSKLGVHEDIIEQVCQCIMATEMPQHTKNLLEEIVCDADLFHFGETQFGEMSKKLKKERELYTGEKISRSVWKKESLRVLTGHHYKTAYVQQLNEEGKQANIDKINRWLTENAASQEQPATDPIKQGLPTTGSTKRIEKDNDKKPERGIETMFRISSNNHQRLSDMADNKANIMITTTSIILSILLSVLLRKLEDNPHLIIPSFLLLASCLVTMIFSIKATRPVLPSGRFTQEDLKLKKTNLLFFGNFYRMHYEEYNAGMEAMMNDRSFLYGSLTLDVYSQGIVLGKKYRLLRIAYNVFMYGVSGSVIAFFLAVLLAM